LFLSWEVLEQYETAPVGRGKDRLAIAGDTTLEAVGCGLRNSGPTKRDQRLEDRANGSERCEKLLVR
jgi:hypothetical protein